jgi:septum formation protein
VRLTLVSASPRRHELLSKLGIPFDVYPTDAKELWEADNARELAILNARIKVERSSFSGDRSRLLLGADTLISLEDRIFGKAADGASARVMLATLSGRVHDVITGVCLSGPARSPSLDLLSVERAAISRVQFRDLTARDIEDYLASDEWRDKAGAYAIQGLGNTLISKLDGDYDNVVGLPTTLIHDLLGTHFGHCRFL